MRRTIPFLLALLLSGCLSGSSNEPVDVDDPVPAADLPCEFPLFDGLRSREVDVAVDETDRSRVAAAAMVTPPTLADAPGDGDVSLWTALARSQDGGFTWDHAILPYWPGDTRTHPEFIGAGGFGDPILTFAPDGDLYMSAIILTGLLQYNMVSMRFAGDSLQPSDITVFSRGGLGETFNDVPGPNPLFYNDKNDQTVDPDSGAWYVSWMWRSNVPEMQTVPVVSRSMDGGRTWADPVQIIDSPLGGLTAPDANVAPAPFILGDSVFVVWARGGDSVWAAQAPRDTLDFGAPYEIASLGSGGGGAGNVLNLPLVNVAVGPAPDGTGERAWLTVIRVGDGQDVGLWWSDDGASWTGPIMPHADTSGHQVIPTVAVAPDGRVAAQYLDFAQEGDRYHAVMSVSNDGTAWDERIMTTTPTDPAHAGDAIQGHVGDYFGNAWTSAGLFGAWQDGRDGTADDRFSEIYGCLTAA